MVETVKKTKRKLPPGPGRPKGSTNKVTRELREMVLEALERSGGVNYLAERAVDPKTATAFLSLLGKVLPTTVKGSLDVKGGLVIVPAKADV